MSVPGLIPHYRHPGEVRGLVEIRRALSTRDPGLRRDDGGTK